MHAITEIEYLNFISFINTYSPLFILINFLVILAYTVCTFLAQKRILPPSLANLFRLFSVMMSSLLLTLLFAKHGFDIHNQQKSFWVILGILSVMNWFNLWLKDFDIRYVLSTQVITTIFVLLLSAFKIYSILKGVPALTWLLNIYSLAVPLAYVLRFDNFSVFQLLNKQLERYVWYNHFMEHAKMDTTMTLYVSCGLTINMINLIYLIQVADGWLVNLLIVFCVWSIGYQTLLAIGLCAICKTHPVKYRWNFVIQSYVNLWVTFKTVWRQTRMGNLPRQVPLINLGMALLLTAIQSPIVAYCAGPEPLNEYSGGSSSEFSTEGGSTDLFGNKNKPDVNNKAVGEGTVASKAVKAAKPAADFVAKEAKDIGGRYYDKGKDAVASAGVAGTTAFALYSGAQAAKTAGFELPTITEISHLSTEEHITLLEKLNALKREGIALTKEQLELEKQLNEAKELTKKHLE